MPKTIWAWITIFKGEGTVNAWSTQKPYHEQGEIEYVRKTPDTIILSRKALEGERKDGQAYCLDDPVAAENRGTNNLIDKILNGEIK